MHYTLVYKLGQFTYSALAIIAVNSFTAALVFYAVNSISFWRSADKAEVA